MFLWDGKGGRWSSGRLLSGRGSGRLRKLHLGYQSRIQYLHFMTSLNEIFNKMCITSKLTIFSQENLQLQNFDKLFLKTDF
jgi:hypothetical protein